MAAATATAAALVSAGAGLASSYQSWEQAKDQKDDVGKIKALRKKQAGDMLEQIGSEDLIYEDELDMIQKQTALAGQKLDLQTSQQVEGLGEQVGQAVGSLTAGSKYGGGAAQRGMSEVEAKYEETMGDLKESYDMSMDDLALRDEQAERDAFLRHEEIVGGLEAQREEILAML
tara:strand:- start:1100 stop:1621 length:522 start_codon:yes stop_codon:yes gene_type:complete